MSPASPGARILILNFNDYELLDETMQRFIYLKAPLYLLALKMRQAVLRKNMTQ